MRLLIVLVALLLPGTAYTQTSVKFQSPGIWGLAEPATISATVHKPDGPGPFPAVIVLHNCAGITDHTTDWVRRIVGWGYVAIAPDSFGSRSKANYLCENTVAVNEFQRVSDVIGAAQSLATLPYVRKDSIGVIGFSHGAGPVMKGAQKVMEWPKYGIKAGVAYYPLCNPDAERNFAVPVLVLIGDKDDWTPAARCQTVAKEALDPSMITLKVYPDATHSFDRNLPTRWVQGMGEGNKVATRKQEYSAPATRDAEAQTKAFFARFLN